MNKYLQKLLMSLNLPELSIMMVHAPLRVAFLTTACLIVEVRDHRPRGQPPATTSRGPFITPSQNSQTAAPQPQSQPQPAPAAQTKEAPRTYRTLLRPTEQSLWQDFGQLADTSGGEFTDWMGLQVEGGLMVLSFPFAAKNSWRCCHGLYWIYLVPE